MKMRMKAIQKYNSGFMSIIYMRVQKYLSGHLKEITILMIWVIF